MEHTRSALFEPNNWVEYADAGTGEVVAVDRFYDPQRDERRKEPPPGGWAAGEPV